MSNKLGLECNAAWPFLFAQVLVPDDLPGGLSPDVEFSMVAGDFLEVYRDQIGEWNCVATCECQTQDPNIASEIPLQHS